MIVRCLIATFLMTSLASAENYPTWTFPVMADPDTVELRYPAHQTIGTGEKTGFESDFFISCFDSPMHLNISIFTTSLKRSFGYDGSGSPFVNVMVLGETENEDFPLEMKFSHSQNDWQVWWTNDPQSANKLAEMLRGPKPAITLLLSNTEYVTIPTLAGSSVPDAKYVLEGIMRRC